MAALYVRLSNHGASNRACHAGVDPLEGSVYITLGKETDDEIEVDRALTPDEARALAAALLHGAAEVER